MKLIVILLFASFICNAQLLDEDNISLKNFKIYEKVGNNLFGNVIKSGEAITTVSISNIRNKTYIAIKSTLLKVDEQVYIISSINKIQQSDKLTLNIDCYNGMDFEKKNVKLILEYADKKLTKLYFPIPQGVFEFY